MANVGAYSDVLVVDMVGGLVVGAVAERLGGKFCCTLMLLMPLYEIVQLN
jgi:tRNA (adenine-N(1)-)-methyltransferase non-catalytic subunit